CPPLGVESPSTRAIMVDGPLEAKFAKVICARQLETSKYDRVLYLDCDVLTVAPVVEALALPDSLYAFEERLELEPKDWDCFMPKHWPHKPGMSGWNSGIIT